MTDTPDLRTLAAEAMCDAFDAMPDDAHRPPPRVTATTVMPPPEPPCAPCLAATDAVLAAVLPAHRRQVLAEAADTLQPDIDWQRKTYGHERGTVAIGRLIGMQDAQAAIRRLASAAPETAPRPRHDDETAPAVPEATPAPAEDHGAGRPGAFDEASWRAGGPNSRIPGRHVYRDGRETPIGSMDTPELSAQVVAEHRHAVEYRAMMRGAEQRQAERGAEGRHDETAPAVPEATPDTPELDGAPWRVGSHYGIHLYRQAGAEPGDDDEPIGTMFRPELAAQVVAEHRHAVEYRAMLRGAEQRQAERGAEGRHDDTAALAARLGFVPAAERDGWRRACDEAVADSGRMEAERDGLRKVVNRVRMIVDVAAEPDGGGIVTIDEFAEILLRDIRAALAAADGPPLSANTDPKEGGDSCARYLAERFPTAPQGADEGNDRG